jgi:16S rRNA G1207 methylase RsmC
MVKFSTGVLYAHRNEEVVNVGVPQKRKRSETKEQICSFGDQKSLTSSSLVVNQQQPIQEESTVKVAPDEAEEAEVGVTEKQSRQQEEPPKLEEMNATSKWFLSASGLFPAELIDSLSFM